MEVIYGLLPSILLLGLLGIVAFIWAVRGNQDNVMRGAERRILTVRESGQEGNAGRKG